MGAESLNLKKYEDLYKAIKPVAEGTTLPNYGQSAKDQLDTFAASIKQAVGYMSKSDWDGSVQKEIEKSVESISKLAVDEVQSAQVIIGATGPLSILVTALEQTIDAVHAYEGYVAKVNRIEAQNAKEAEAAKNAESTSSGADGSNSSTSDSGETKKTDNGLGAAKKAMADTLEVALKCQEQAEAHITNVRNYFDYDFEKHEAKDYNPNLPFVSYITEANKDLIAEGLKEYNEIHPEVKEAKIEDVETTTEEKEEKKDKKDDKPPVKEEPKDYLVALDSKGNKINYLIDDKGKYVIYDDKGKEIEKLTKEEFEKKYFTDDRIFNATTLLDLEKAKDGDYIDLPLIQNNADKSPWKSDNAVTDNFVIVTSQKEFDEATQQNLKAIQTGNTKDMKNIVLRNDFSVTIQENGKNKLSEGYHNICRLRLEKNSSGEYVYVPVKYNGEKMENRNTIIINDIGKDSSTGNSVTVVCNDASNLSKNIHENKVHMGDSQELAVCKDASSLTKATKAGKIIKVPKGSSISIPTNGDITKMMNITADKDMYLIQNANGQYVNANLSDGVYSDITSGDKAFRFNWNGNKNCIDLSFSLFSW